MRYSEERKQGAYAMLAEHSIAYTSEQLGIPETTLLRWRKRIAVDQAKEQEQVTEQEDEQIIEESTSEGIATDEVSAFDEKNKETDLESTTHSAIVRQAKELLNAPPDTVLSEVALLISENENLKNQNQQLRKSLHYLIT